MRWHRPLILLLALLVFLPASWPTEAEARRGFGFSRSMGSRGFGRSVGRRSAGRSSWGSSRSRGYRRKGGVFGSKRGKRGQAFGQGQRPRLNKRGHRMMGKTQRSVAGRNARAATYGQRFSRPVTMMNPRFYGGRAWGSWGYGMYSVGLWDVFFLSTVSRMFWYHRWHDPGIQRALYQENLLQKEELEKVEKRVAELEAQGLKRDPEYLPEDADPDLAYSREYVEKHPDEFYAEDEPPQESGSGLWSLICMAMFGSFFYLSFVRRA